MPKRRCWIYTEAQRAAVTALENDEPVSRRRSGSRSRPTIPNDAIERQHAAPRSRRVLAREGEARRLDEAVRARVALRAARHEWFVGGKLNATMNCIDRHVYGDRRNKAALIWVGEDGEEHTYTYNRLYREVNRFANALKELGRREGRPRRRLHAARPGGDHLDARLRAHRGDPLVVFAGHGDPGARRPDRGLAARRSSSARTSPTRRGKQLPLKPTVDEAVRDLLLGRARDRAPPRLAARGTRRSPSSRSASTTSTTCRTGTRSTARRSRWTRRTRSSSSTPPGRPGSRRGSSTRPAAISSGRRTSRAPSTSSATRHLLVHLGHRLDRRSLVHRLRAALDAARRSSAARARRTSLRPTSPGSSASASASTSCSPPPPRCACG